LRSNTEGYGGNTQETDSQNGDTTTSSGRRLYHLQFLLQAASWGTFGYNYMKIVGGGESLQIWRVAANILHK